MKKALTILVVLCSFVTANAKINFGVKAGLNVANIETLSTETALDKDSYTGFYVGPKVDWDMFKRLGLNAAILYSQAGMEFDNSEEALELNSLMIPLNLSIKVLGTDKLGVSIEAGPQFEFNLGEKIHEMEDGNLHLDNSTLSLNIGAKLHLLNFLQVGVNYNVPFGSTKEFKFADMENEEAYKIHTIQVSAAIVF